MVINGSSHYIKSRVSALHTESPANINDKTVNITRNRLLPAREKSPILASVKITRRNEATTAAFDDLSISPANNAINPMLMVTNDFARSCI